MKKWVERAAIITGALSFIGVLIIFFGALHEHFTTSDQIVSNNNKQAISEDLVKKDTAKKNVVIKEKIKKKEPLPPPPKEKIVITETGKEVIKKPKLVESIKPEPKKPAVDNKEKNVQKQLSNEELEDLYSAINARRSVNSGTYACVKIEFLERSNNVTAARQVEQYLTSKKLTITGRETIEKSRKGIYIKSSGGCITVTIGNL